MTNQQIRDALMEIGVYFARCASNAAANSKNKAVFSRWISAVDEAGQELAKSTTSYAEYDGDTWVCAACGETVGWAEGYDWHDGKMDACHYKYCPKCGREVNWDD